LHIPETAYAPDEGYVQVGLYLPGGPRLFTADGQDAVRLATVDIQPQPGELPNPLNVNFGNQVALVGYSMDRRMVHPGETIHLTLYWQGLVPLEENYRAFAHVLGVEDQVWANSDSPPDDGAAPTKQWELGQVVADRRKLIIGLTTPPNFYDVEVGMYLLGGDRLLVLAEDGHGRGEQVLLGKIRVVSDE
jgi:hypothetical protein